MSANRICTFAVAAWACVAVVVAGQAPQAQPPQPGAPAFTDYIVGPQDVLTINSFDQADLSGRFTVEADGTFTYPLIGRVKAGGLTLRQVETELKKRLKDEKYFVNPQLSVAVEQFKSQKVFIVGEVRNPGAYPLSGDMSLIEALARAGSTLPSASGDALIVHAAPGQTIPEAPATNGDPANMVRINLRDLESGSLSQNAVLRDGDTIFVPRAQSVYVFGQVKNPGAYSLQQNKMTVLQALSLAGGVTENGSTNRIKIVRMVKGDKVEIKVKLGDIVQPGDTVIVPERYF
jgi:polysaccharide export outer membrane protein